MLGLIIGRQMAGARKRREGVRERGGEGGREEPPPPRTMPPTLQEVATRYGRSSRLRSTCLYGGASRGPQARLSALARATAPRAGVCVSCVSVSACARVCCLCGGIGRVSLAARCSAPPPLRFSCFPTNERHIQYRQIRTYALRARARTHTHTHTADWRSTARGGHMHSHPRCHPVIPCARERARGRANTPHEHVMHPRCAGARPQDYGSLAWLAGANRVSLFDRAAMRALPP